MLPIYSIMLWYGYRCGDLIRWISDWHVYAVDSLGDVHGEKPHYSYGVVLANYDHAKVVAVFCHDTHGCILLNLDLTDCEVISRSQKVVDI